MITIRELIIQSSKKYSQHIAFQIMQNGEFKTTTYAQVEGQAKSISNYLSQIGIQPGDRVALLSENRPEWPIMYLSIGSLGAIVVPLDILSMRESHYNLINNSGSKVLIVSEKHIEVAIEAKQKCQTIENIIIISDEKENEQYKSFQAIIEKKYPDFPQNVKIDDVVSIVYTSGTTGSPKGVMLTHNNIMSNVIATANLFELGPGDQFLSILPLHHTFETTAGFLGPFYKGACITYAESLKSYVILERMKQTSTTIMAGVPLFYKLFYEGILRKVEERGAVAKTIFYFLLLISNFFKTFIGVNIGKKLFKKVHDNFGGNIRFFVSGGSAIDPEIINGFDLMGFTILQGYGLSESAPILSACTLEHNRIGSVGRPIPGVEINIADKNKREIGEILARGPNIMQGYYHNKEATDEILKKGWLSTGDLGYLDDDGYLFITGRIKDVIVTASGLNVYPEEIEFYLNRIPGIKESCIIGLRSRTGARLGQEEVFAVIVPDMEYFDKYGTENAVSIDRSFIQNVIKEKVYDLNEKFPEYKRVSNYLVRDDELPKTSTRKIKRFLVKKLVLNSDPAKEE